MIRDELLAATRSTLEDLEAISGYPVSFLEDASLKTLAAIRIASDRQPIHLIRYRPGAKDIDYLVAFEAALAIRTYRHAPERRLQLSGQPAAREQIRAEVARMHPELPPDRRQSFSDFLFDSLLTQLRSVPPGLLVDYSLYRLHPEIRSLQARSVASQLAENVKALGPEVTRQFPAIIVNANRAMNAAYAIAMATLLQAPQHQIPYQAMGLEQTALDLLALQPSPDAPEPDDTALITAWAERLSITSWIAWVPLA